MHQTAFDNLKTTIAKDVVLAYTGYSQIFETYTDSSKFQLGTVSTQEHSTAKWTINNSIYHDTSKEPQSTIEATKPLIEMLTPNKKR